MRERQIIPNPSEFTSGLLTNSLGTGKLSSLVISPRLCVPYACSERESGWKGELRCTAVRSRCTIPGWERKIAGDSCCLQSKGQIFCIRGSWHTGACRSLTERSVANLLSPDHMSARTGPLRARVFYHPPHVFRLHLITMRGKCTATPYCRDSQMTVPDGNRNLPSFSKLALKEGLRCEKKYFNQQVAGCPLSKLISPHENVRSPHDPSQPSRNVLDRGQKDLAKLAFGEQTSRPLLCQNRVSPGDAEQHRSLSLARAALRKVGTAGRTSSLISGAKAGRTRYLTPDLCWACGYGTTLSS